MPFFDHYPYTNLHNVNLDWILQKVKEWGQLVENNDQNYKDFSAFITAEFEAYKNEIETYLNTEAIVDAVNEWLDDHPEATTTVQDGSITFSKFAANTLDFVYPEFFGAVGDGATDDTDSIQAAVDFCIENGTRLRFLPKTYKVVSKQLFKKYVTIDSRLYAIIVDGNVDIDLNGATLYVETTKSNATNLSMGLTFQRSTQGRIENGTITSNLESIASDDPNYTRDSGGLLQLFDCRNVTVKNITATYFYGDSFQINGIQRGQPYTTVPFENFICNIEVINCTFSNSLRHAVTIGKANTVTFRDCTMSDCTGTSYSSPVDVEPYYGYGNAYNLRFINCTSRNCRNAFSLQSLSGGYLENCAFDRGLMLRASEKVRVVDSNTSDLTIKAASIDIRNSIISTVVIQSSATITQNDKPEIYIKDCIISGGISQTLALANSEDKWKKFTIDECEISLSSTSSTCITFAEQEQVYEDGIIIKNCSIKTVMSGQIGTNRGSLFNISYEKVKILNNQLISDVLTAGPTNTILTVSANYCYGLEFNNNIINVERIASVDTYTNSWSSLVRINNLREGTVEICGNKTSFNGIAIRTSGNYNCISNGNTSQDVTVNFVDNLLIGCSSLGGGHIVVGRNINNTLV